MEFKKKTIIGEDNNEPPKNYIGVKSDGNAYEFNHTTRQGEKIMSSNGSGSSDNIEINLSKTANIINKLFTPTAPQPIGVYSNSGLNSIIYDYEDYMMYRNGTDTKIIDSWTETEQSNILQDKTLLYPSGTILQKGMPLNVGYIDVEYPILLTNGANEGLLVYNPLPDSESDEIVQDEFYMEEVTLNNKIYAALRKN